MGLPKRLILTAATAGICLAAWPLAAPDSVPVAQVQVDPVMTAAVSTPQEAESPVYVLKSGLDALKQDDLANARAIRDSLPTGSLDRHILEWAIALSGNPSVPSRDIAAAAADLPGWPGLVALRRNFERALYRENPPAKEVIAAFARSAPQAPVGAALLARAHVLEGKPNAAHEVLAPIWRQAFMSAEDEQAILSGFSGLLTAEDHFHRMSAMLYDERPASAGRVAKLANAEPLFNAWSAAIRKDAKTASLLKAVPAEQQKATGFQFAKALWLRKTGKLKDAAQIMAEAPDDAASLIDPDAWWNERRILARSLWDAGQGKLAYQTASMHAAQSSRAAAEAEFHAGWIALRALKDPKLAETHFTRLLAISSMPQSLARGYYWLGRAIAASGRDPADAYRRAAHFGTTFYGQLAAAKTGASELEIPLPAPSPAEIREFEARESVSAIRRLQAAGHGTRARTIYYALADELSSAGEIALLAGDADKIDDHFVALKVGKIAAARGLDVGALSHPLGAIPVDADIGASGKALAYAIARQESEFNTGAVSKAGALGLLQLMPSTAEEVAKRKGLPFEKFKLTSEPAYNATLGAHYLGEQIHRFDGSYILTFAGYNAGPRRAQEWMKKYGDPRGKDIEFVVDWIERIPFTETRHYVQRIMENYQVYKARLGDKVSIENDLIYGRRG
jgi:soluble lytic murein transglycosylase